MKTENRLHISSGRLSGRMRCAAALCAITTVSAVHLAHPLFAQQSAASAYSTPGDAIQGLFKAVQSNDTRAIERILGGPTDLASSLDNDQDKIDRDRFVQKYQEMHRLHREADGSVTLYVGAENWPFPIPLVEQHGAWHYDLDAGGKEVLYRRIGENEFRAIEICHQVAAAPIQAVSGVEAGTVSSVGSGLSEASRNSSAGVLMSGYYFRVFATATGNGGKAGAVGVVAYPAEYRVSGVMTFMITGNGVVYEKDLGANTSVLGGRLSSFRKDATWRPADE